LFDTRWLGQWGLPPYLKGRPPQQAPEPKARSPVSNYVDLKRNFVPVAEDAETDLAIGSLWGRKYGGWLDWPELLDHARVVLLAEAQSGKTEEFKHAAAGLRDGGRTAFYATIEQLADGRFSLSPAERALFDCWKVGSDRAWFFLDSVDEARLNRKKFDDALRHIASEIGPALGRASVLVSCRVSDWKGKSDRLTILDILPVPKPAPAPAPAPADDRDAALLDPIFDRKEPEQPKRGKEEKKKPDLLVIQLVTLTDEQRRSFAQANGVVDIDAFMEAIERQGLDVRLVCGCQWAMALRKVARVARNLLQASQWSSSLPSNSNASKS
jgi:hypothetical protein